MAKVTRAERYKIIRELDKVKPRTVKEYAEALGVSRSYAQKLVHEAGVDYKGKSIANKTLCFLCENRKCPWALYHVPVVGWDAVATKVPIQGQADIDSFIVLTCPDFIAESMEKNKFRNLCVKIDTYLDNLEKCERIIIGAATEKVITAVMSLDEFSLLLNVEIVVEPKCKSFVLK